MMTLIGSRCKGRNVSFFYCYVPLRDLHSFPTRRSSDLAEWRRLWTAYLEFYKATVSEDVYRTTRSEEHTSELQSLAYIVCRLLLEKKKTGLDKPLVHLLYRQMQRRVATLG